MLKKRFTIFSELRVAFCLRIVCRGHGRSWSVACFYSLNLPSLLQLCPHFCTHSLHSTLFRWTICGQFCFLTVTLLAFSMRLLANEALICSCILQNTGKNDWKLLPGKAKPLPLLFIWLGRVLSHVPIKVAETSKSEWTLRPAFLWLILSEMGKLPNHSVTWTLGSLILTSLGIVKIK